MLETLQPGQTWSQLGFMKCITTSEFQKEFIENVMRNVSFDILKPFISDNFEKQSLPAKPIIAIHSRDQRDAINIIKTFYIKFPQYRWITFRDMRGLSEKEFASTLKDCFLSVWVDETSGFGTFPLESMKVGVPVLGLVPNLLPSWMNENNGLWVNNKNQVVDFIADFLQNWLEDNVKPELKEEMLKTVENLSTKEEFEKVAIQLFERYINTRLTSFEEQLSKFETTE
jgi:glycosyltransferase involved in cell wall biosynthesis